MQKLKDILMKMVAVLKKLPERRLMMVLSVIVGLGCGLAAVLLRGSIHYIQGLFAPLTASHNVLFLILPGVGMLLAMLFVRYVIRDDISHGVTKVLVAVSKNESKIKPHNMWSSVAASAVTIGFGGSVGAEAPIVYTGAAIGSNVGRAFGLSYKDITLLLGCGAAGAVAGIFNAPLAGVLFTLEILLFNISMSTILPLLLSTVSATVVSYIFHGRTIPFECALEPFMMRNLLFYLVLGVVCAFCSVYFTRMTLFVEDKIKSVTNPFVRWAVAAACLGLLIFLFPPLYGEGYTSLVELLNGAQAYDGASVFGFLSRNAWGVPVLFLLILLLKVFSMSFTNAGGGVGGTFGPTLVEGAFAGFIVARLINLVFAGSEVSVPEQNFVLVGMAGLMAGVMQAPMTAIFLIAEISGGYDLLLPLILCSAVSFGIARTIEPYSIYAKRIAKRGELLTHDNDQAILTLLKTRDLIRDKYPRVNADATLGEIVKIIADSQAQVFAVVGDDGIFQGLIEMDKVRKLMFRTDLYKTRRVFNIMEDPVARIDPEESMDSVMDKFEKTRAWRLPVVDGDGKYLGFISRSRLLAAYRDELKIISHD